MALIIPGKLVGATMPRGPVEVDWTNPLTRGLLGCYLPGLMGGLDAAGIGPYLVKQANGTWGGNSDGPAHVAANTSGNNQLMATTPASWKFTSAFSMRWRGTVTAQVSVPANNAGMIGLSYASTAIAPYWGLVLYPQAPGYPAIAIDYNNGTLQTPIGGNILNGFNVINDVVVTLTMGGTWAIYNNGILALSNTAVSGTPSFTSTSQIIVGDGPWDTSETKMVTNLAAFWNRALTATEVLQMYLAPYSFLTPVASGMIYTPSQIALWAQSCM